MSNKKIICSFCKKELLPDPSQNETISRMKNKGLNLMMLECSSCGLGFPYNPQGFNIAKETQVSSNISWRSPISGSHGFVSHVEEDGEPSFYGDGTTGCIWFDKKEFFSEIDKIIKLYSHRRDFYVWKNNEWYPAEHEPENIDELIDSEMVEDIQNFERG